jgi:hypothetical protein
VELTPTVTGGGVWIVRGGVNSLHERNVSEAPARLCAVGADSVLGRRVSCLGVRSTAAERTCACAKRHFNLADHPVGSVGRLPAKADSYNLGRPNRLDELRGSDLLVCKKGTGITEGGI